MIKKLRNAGLGFYVRESETTHKLGECMLFEPAIKKYDIVFIPSYILLTFRGHSITTLSLSCTGPPSKHEALGLRLWAT